MSLCQQHDRLVLENTHILYITIPTEQLETEHVLHVGGVNNGEPE